MLRPFDCAQGRQLAPPRRGPATTTAATGTVALQFGGGAKGGRKRQRPFDKLRVTAGDGGDLARAARPAVAPYHTEAARGVGEGFILQDGMASGTHPSFPSEEGMGTTASRQLAPPGQGRYDNGGNRDGRPTIRRWRDT